MISMHSYKYISWGSTTAAHLLQSVISLSCSHTSIYAGILMVTLTSFFLSATSLTPVRSLGSVLQSTLDHRHRTCHVRFAIWTSLTLWVQLLEALFCTLFVQTTRGLCSNSDTLYLTLHLSQLLYFCMRTYLLRQS